MLSIAALGFQSPLVTSRVASSRVDGPVMVTRREAFSAVLATAVAGAAVAPANAVYDNGQNKAKAVFGQKVLALADASPEAILDNQAAIETYVSQMIRSTGKRNVDGRRLGGTPLGDAAVETIAAAKSGDKAAANAGVKKIVALTKLCESTARAAAGRARSGCYRRRWRATRGGGGTHRLQRRRCRKLRLWPQRPHWWLQKRAQSRRWQRRRSHCP